MLSTSVFFASLHLLSLLVVVVTYFVCLLVGSEIFVVSVIFNGFDVGPFWCLSFCRIVSVVCA